MSTKLPTIKEMCDNFIKGVVAADAPEIQKIEMAKAFHGGAFSMLELLSNGISVLPGNTGVFEMEKLHKEMREYLRVIRKAAQPCKP